jgi:hypothetical protein
LRIIVALRPSSVYIVARLKSLGKSIYTQVAVAEFKFMRFDIASLTAGQIAGLTAAASVIAAVLAGVFGLVVAGVNAWATERTSRNTARRAYRLSLVKPFLDTLDAEMDVCENAVQDLTKSDHIMKEQLFKICEKVSNRRRSTDIFSIYSLTRIASQKNTRVERFRSSQIALTSQMNDVDIEIERFVKYLNDRPGKVLITFDHHHDDSEARKRLTNALSSFTLAALESRAVLEELIFS